MSSPTTSKPGQTANQQAPKPHPNFSIIQAPSRTSLSSPPNITIFLSGSIDDSSVPDWRSNLSTRLSHLPVTILNPLRTDWDSTWEQETSDPRFVEQVNWELEFLERADIVVVCFATGTMAPITLLELGLAVRGRSEGGEGKGEEWSKSRVLVACPKGYLRRGNVEIVCSRFGVPFLGSLDELAGAVEEKVGRMVGGGEAGQVL